MKRLLYLVILAALISACPNASSKNTAEITIIHMNDLGGRVMPGRSGLGGLARMSTALKDLRRENPNALFLVSGDLITGSPLSTLTKGEAIFRLANMLDISVFAPGNHEFDYGPVQYSRFMDMAEFPFIAANLRKRDGAIYADRPDMFFNVGQFKIRVVGLVTPDTVWLTFPENTEGVTFDDPGQAFQRVSPESDRHTHLVVALTHMGLDDDRKLARKAKGIDLIIGGHSHDLLRRPIRIKNTWIVQAGSEGEYLGVVKVKIDINTNRVRSVKGRIIELGPDIAFDPEMAAAVKFEEAKLPIDPDEFLGTAVKNLDRNENLAPWIAWLIKKSVNADVGIVNRGGIREDIDKGPITYRHIFRVMPFDNRVVVVRMSGFELRRLLGKRQIIPDKSIRIKSNLTYKVATMDFIASLYKFRRKNIETTGFLVRDLMIDYFKVKKTLP